MIPSFTISSFEYPGANTNAYIRTYLNVIINEIKESIKQIIFIKRPNIIINSPLKQTDSYSPKIMFFDQGPIVFEISYPNSNYSFFQVIPLTVSVNTTQSKISIREYTIAFIRRIKLLDQGKDKNLFIEDILFEAKRPVTQKDFNQIENIEVCEPEGFYNKYPYNSEGLTFPDKKQLIRFMPSISTSFISCEYFIQIVGYPHYNVFKKQKIIMPVSVSHSNDNLTHSVIKTGEMLEKQLNKDNNHEGNSMPLSQQSYPTLFNDDGYKDLNNMIYNDNIQFKQKKIII